MLYVCVCASSIYHTQLAKTSFDEIFDLMADVFLFIFCT